MVSSCSAVCPCTSGPDAEIIREHGGEAVARAAIVHCKADPDVSESANMLLRNVKRLDAPKVKDLRPYYER